MEYIEALAALTIDDKINIGLIERFLQELPDKVLNLGVRVLLSVLVLVVGIQLIKFVRKVIKRSLEKGNADRGVIQFLDSFIKAALYVILVMMIASGFGVDAASVTALLGSAGVAIGLAVQGSLSNFVGGVLILLLKPFRVGDYIKEDSNNNEGEVVEIELFYTKLATGDNKIILLPNGTLANSSLTNVTASDSRRMDIRIGISYESDIRQVKEVLQKLLDEDEAVLKEKDHFVYVDELAAGCMMMGVRCWFSMSDYWKGKWRVTEKIKYALDEAGIAIASPQLDVQIKETRSIDIQ